MTLWPNMTSYPTVVTDRYKMTRLTLSFGAIIPFFRDKFDGLTVLHLLWLGWFGRIPNPTCIPSLLLILAHFLHRGGTCFVLLEGQI